MSRCELDVRLKRVFGLPRCQRESVGESAKRTEYSHYLDTELKMDFQVSSPPGASVSPSLVGLPTRTRHRAPPFFHS